MRATIAGSGAGTTKHDIIERLRREETDRGLNFDYCLLTLGASHNRAGSQQAWAPGEVMSIDSGGNLGGYIGDIARMGLLGEPDVELEDLLGEIEAVQQAAFAAVRAGAQGGDVIAAGEAELARQPNRGCTDFVAHGMGLVSHEMPFLMDHPVGYAGEDAGRPLEAGMVLSVETTMLHPRRGFIKLEDTLAVTETGFELYGTEGRGWNRGGRWARPGSLLSGNARRIIYRTVKGGHIHERQAHPDADRRVFRGVRDFRGPAGSRGCRPHRRHHLP
jgi:Xaa-Pro aminopeptidase